MRIKSNYEEDSTNLRILNTTLTEDPLLNLIFVLPVEASKMNFKYGNGIDECKKLIDSNEISNNVIFIQPDYNRIPWYGNHYSDQSRWQMEYTVDLIKKFRSAYFDKTIKVYLLGFSKSGFGSMTIIIKYPDLIDGVMIWDAPLSTKWNEKWGMEDSFGTESNFMNHYYLMRENGIDYKVLKNKLLIIGGFDLFENQTIDFLKILDKNGIKYIYDNTIKYKHEWNRDWIYRLFLHCDYLTKGQN